MLRTRLLARLPLAQAVARTDGDSSSHSSSLVRALGRRDLVLFGITVIVGGGIFVVTGNAAADYAGPAIILSFSSPVSVVCSPPCVMPSWPP